LLEAIAAMPGAQGETFPTDYGKPFTRAGLGQRMRKWCNAAGLPHCSAHGLRKAAAPRRRTWRHESGIEGCGAWTTDRQVSVYTAAVEQKRMAAQAMNPVIDYRFV
jgi:integrase